jgi:RNA polymerase sigma-B factor
LQVARLGLVQAVDRFDVAAGTDFLAFAVPTVMGEVKRYFRDSGWSVSVPRRLKDLQPQLTTTTAEMTQRLGRAPNANELAAALGLDRDDVVEGLPAGGCYRALSTDASARSHDDDDAPALLDRLGQPDAGIEYVEYREALRPLLQRLPERERAVLVMRFFETLSQTEIGDRIGVSQMHVSRLLRRSLDALREGLA